MAVMAPKYLEVPNIEELPISEEEKQWHRTFTENVAFMFECLRSDTVEASAGTWTYLGSGTEGTDGSWRIGTDDSGAIIQHRVGGTWVTNFRAHEDVVIPDDESTPDVAGSWRWWDSGSHLLLQRLESGEWDTKMQLNDVTGEWRWHDNGTGLVAQVKVDGTWTDKGMEFTGVTGTYRWYNDGTDYHLQVDVAGSWVTKWTFNS